MGEPLDHESRRDPFERRLRSVLAQELEQAERDFRPPVRGDGRRRFGSWIGPLLVAAILLPVALIVVATIGGQPSIAPTASAPAALSPPTSVGPSPAGPAALTHVSMWGLAFDYPSAWRMTISNVNEHYITILGYVGSGSGSVPCTAVTPPPGQSYPRGISCTDVWDLPPGTVVVQFTSDQPLGRDSPMTTHPAGYAPVEVGGLPAFFARNLERVPNADVTLSWVLSVPNDLWGSYHLTAGIRGPGLPGLEDQVRAMVASIRYDPPLVPLPTGAEASGAAVAALRTAIDRLQAGTKVFDCFSTLPGAVKTASVTEAIGRSLRKPLPVRCSTSIEATPFQLWRLTLTYAWQAASDRTAGSAAIMFYLTADGTPLGPISVLGPMPYER